jgi:hypothetical protein
MVVFRSAYRAEQRNIQVNQGYLVVDRFLSTLGPLEQNARHDMLQYKPHIHHNDSSLLTFPIFLLQELLQMVWSPHEILDRILKTKHLTLLLIRISKRFAEIYSFKAPNHDCRIL